MKLISHTVEKQSNVCPIVHSFQLIWVLRNNFLSYSWLRSRKLLVKPSAPHNFLLLSYFNSFISWLLFFYAHTTASVSQIEPDFVEKIVENVFLFYFFLMLIKHKTDEFEFVGLQLVGLRETFQVHRSVLDVET